MKIGELKNKKIAIFGFGLEGRSLVQFFLKNKISDIIIYDEKPLSEENLRYLESQCIEYYIGNFGNQDLIEVDVAFRSPGIKKEKLLQVLEDKTKISSLTNVFFANCRGKTIAVTGTKGKSTTVMLVDSIMRSANKKTFVGGNIGKSVLDFVDETTDDSYSILELSSFQLDDLEYGPDVALILPVLIDHLDYHKDESEYLEAKSKIVKNMKSDSLVIAADDKNAKFVTEGFSGTILIVSTSALHNFDELSRELKTPAINIAMAFEFAKSQDIEIDLNAIKKHFIKPQYRIEYVGEALGLKFYNDSASTNPISTIEAMKVMGGRFAIIMGGSSKNLSFRVLAEEIVKNPNAERVYLIGQTAREIKSELEKAGFLKPIKNLETLEKVFADIAREKHNFDEMLFSPASASFDQYKNYRERGISFTKLVDSLKVQ